MFKKKESKEKVTNPTTETTNATEVITTRVIAPENDDTQMLDVDSLEETPQQKIVRLKSLVNAAISMSKHKGYTNEVRMKLLDKADMYQRELSSLQKPA